jgi:hydroxylamine reductase
MFCNQCEQTVKGEACTKGGVCGKPHDVASLQDLLVHALIGLSSAAAEAGSKGIVDRGADVFMVKALFSTLTNVNFDAERLAALIGQAVKVRDSLAGRVQASGGSLDLSRDDLAFKPAGTLEGLVAQGERVGLKSYPAANADILSLKHTLLFGIKGLAAYADHAQILGQEDPAVYAFVHEALASLADGNITLEAALGLVLKCGEVNLRTMELLDAANTGTYGHPVPTAVSLGAKKGKAILVSGHDLKDLAELLRQTEGKGINIYTHGEMLPCHGYPGLKKYSHLRGHYGTAWQNQAKEFAEFPGAILMTTNCIQRPQPSYRDNIFTAGLVGWPDVAHIAGNDFTPVIKRAMELPGFAADKNGKSVMVGFARNAVLGLADKVIEAVKGKKIRHFFLVAGCDGAKPGRNYYTNPCLRKVPLLRQGSGEHRRHPEASGRRPVQ